MDNGNGNLLSLFLASASLDILRRMGRKIPRQIMTKESQKCLKYRDT
jgi:hypothetical protein